MKKDDSVYIAHLVTSLDRITDYIVGYDLESSSNRKKRKMPLSDSLR